jgi:hypothetical protein
MKILLLADYYPIYLQNFYKINDLNALNYNDHLEKLLDDYFGSFVSYYRHFKKLGHDARLIIGNDYKLQQKWINETKLSLEPVEINKKEIVMKQIEDFQPDVFFMGSMFDYYGDFLKKVSGMTKNIFTWISCPHPENLDFSNIKCVISSAEKFVEKFRNKGLNSEVLKAAFDQDIVSRLDDKKTIDVSFIGGLSKKTHKKRVEGLEFLVNNGVNLTAFGYGLEKKRFPFYRNPLERNFRGELWGLEMYRTLNHSRISLNFHIDIVKGWSGNMRMFEAAGCGSLLMTENTHDISDFFIPGKEIVTYDDKRDLLDKINYYLDHEDEVNVITKNGQRACIDRHGYQIRIKEFENIINKYGN